MVVRDPTRDLNADGPRRGRAGADQPVIDAAMSRVIYWCPSTVFGASPVATRPQWCMAPEYQTMPAMDYSRIARFYDAYVTTDFDVAFFVREAAGAAAVLELMCGTGRVSIPLIEAGVSLTCVDNSPEMLAALRRKLADRRLSACVRDMDVCDLSFERRFDLVIIPFHAFAEIVAERAQQQALAGIHGVLSDEGRFICTLHNPAVRLRSVTGQRVERGTYELPAGEGTLCVDAVEQYDAANQIVRGTQFYEVQDENGAVRSRDSIDIRFYLHARETFEHLVEAAEFRTLELYGDYARAPFDPERSPFMVWVLRRRAGRESR